MVSYLEDSNLQSSFILQVKLLRHLRFFGVFIFLVVTFVFNVFYNNYHGGGVLLSSWDLLCFTNFYALFCMALYHDRPVTSHIRNILLNERNLKSCWKYPLKWRHDLPLKRIFLQANSCHIILLQLKFPRTPQLMCAFMEGFPRKLSWTWYTAWITLIYRIKCVIICNLTTWISCSNVPTVWSYCHDQCSR
jgi:hypothetical protein